MNKQKQPWNILVHLKSGMSLSLVYYCDSDTVSDVVSSMKSSSGGFLSFFKEKELGTTVLVREGDISAMEISPV